MDRKRAVFLLACFLVAAACGGGSGGAAAPPVVTPPLPAAPVLGGFWVGEIFFDATADTDVCVGMMAETREFRFVCALSPVQFVGTLSTGFGGVTGTGLALSTDAFLDGSFTSPLNVEGTLTEQSSLTGTWTTASPGDSGTYSFAYDTEYERDSSLALLEGSWIGLDDLGNPNTSFTIDNAGQFVAQNTNGCTSSGSFTISDSRYNVYQVDSTIVGCPISGRYSGLAAIGDNVAVNDVIILSIDDGARALFVALEK